MVPFDEAIFEELIQRQVRLPPDILNRINAALNRDGAVTDTKKPGFDGHGY